MAITQERVRTRKLTYEDYMSEGEVKARYDIIDGVRAFMTNPIRDHQTALLNVAMPLRAFEESSGLGRVYIAPCDVLITKSPLRTRQPDALFISHERLALCKPDDDPTPILVGPEIVIEILSPSNTARQIADKLNEYVKVGVDECWTIDLKARTIEVRPLLSGRPAVVYGRGEVARSIAFPTLSVEVNRIV